MASAQVDDLHVGEFPKPSEETTLESPAIEGSTKASVTQNIESPYDDEDNEEDVVLPDDLGKQDDEEDQKSLAPQIIEDEDEDEDEDDEPMSKSNAKATDLDEEDVDEDDD
ncbi:uncharacterized protein [Rutidosis leptorrhynchoides]|uniref:uncharacterized protein n=1 Tax=Rutidosis leptorrhynchoides TaxID=125765 RepID=UPI003A99C1E3